MDESDDLDDLDESDLDEDLDDEYEFCHPMCDGCSGPTEHDCEYCTYNASKNSDGHCVCDENYDGESCSEYSGSCYDECTKCLSPTVCEECVENSYIDRFTGLCVCDSDWAGFLCQTFIGDCDSRCNACFGPTNMECIFCG